MDNEFIKHFKYSEPKIELEDNIASIISKIYVGAVNDTEKALEEAIIAMCKAEGITDIYLLNKNAILSALRKQTKERPQVRFFCDDSSELLCPNCYAVLYERKKYCGECGQALEWAVHDLGKWGGADV